VKHKWGPQVGDVEKCPNCGLHRVEVISRHDTNVFYLRWGPGEKAVRPSNGTEPTCKGRLAEYGPQPLVECVRNMVAL
jgi:hypothetical protein